MRFRAKILKSGKTAAGVEVPEKVVAARAVWGEMCGVRFAEAFRAIRRVPSQLW